MIEVDIEADLLEMQFDSAKRIVRPDGSMQHPKSRANAISDPWATVAVHDDAASARPHFDAVTSIRHVLARAALMKCRATARLIKYFEISRRVPSSWPRPCTTAGVKAMEYVVMPRNLILILTLVLLTISPGGSLSGGAQNEH